MYEKTARKSFNDISNARGSHREVFCEKGVLRNFAKFTGKHLCHSLLFNKVAGLRLQRFISALSFFPVFHDFSELRFKLVNILRNMNLKLQG